MYVSAGQQFDQPSICLLTRADRRGFQKHNSQCILVFTAAGKLKEQLQEQRIKQHREQDMPFGISPAPWQGTVHRIQR